MLLQFERESVPRCEFGVGNGGVHAGDVVGCTAHVGILLEHHGYGRRLDTPDVGVDALAPLLVEVRQGADYFHEGVAVVGEGEGLSLPVVEGIGQGVQAHVDEREGVRFGHFDRACDDGQGVDFYVAVLVGLGTKGYA